MNTTLRRVIGPLLATVAVVPLALTAATTPAVAAEECGTKVHLGDVDSGASKVELSVRKCANAWRLVGTVNDTKTDRKGAIGALTVTGGGKTTTYTEKVATNEAKKSFDLIAVSSARKVTVETYACNSWGQCTDKTKKTFDLKNSGAELAKHAGGGGNPGKDQGTPRNPPACHDKESLDWFANRDLTADVSVWKQDCPGDGGYKIFGTLSDKVNSDDPDHYAQVEFKLFDSSYEQFDTKEFKYQKGSDQDPNYSFTATTKLYVLSAQVRSCTGGTCYGSDWTRIVVNE